MKRDRSILRRMSALACVITCLLVCLAGCAKEQSPPPERLAASLTDDGILLDWDAAEGARGYRLYRKQKEEADFKFITDTEDLQYLDTAAGPGTAYVYKLTVLGESGESQGCESEEVFRPTDPEVERPFLTRPVITSVTKMDRFTNVILFENGEEDCQYEVLRADRADGTYRLLGTTSGKTFYDDTADGKAYYYQVRAVREEEQGPISAAVVTGTNPGHVISVPVFMYHEFVTQQDLDSGVAFDEYAIYRDDFEQDLIWLRNHGYTAITTGELVDYLEGRGTMPKKPVILTIDDGKLGVYKNAYPLLKQYKMKADLALIGEEIDNATANPQARENDPAPYCTWDEIKEMSDSGVIEMISHTYYLHAYINGNRQGANSAEGETEVQFLMDAHQDSQTMQDKLKEVTGRGTVTLSYPYSIRSQVSDQTWMDCGYKMMVAGNDDAARKTFTNYFVQEAGINEHSALVRRMVRMNGTSIDVYLRNAQASDE